MISKKLEEKLKGLPSGPGIYFHKDSSGAIIYIGKAANLRNRVRQYFQASRTRDLKTDALVAEIADTDWTELETEVDALVVEAEMVRRYQPRYNILLRDDKSQSYIRIDYKSDYPTVKLTRRPLDDGAEYFGPYFNSFAIKRALRYLRRAFPYATAKPVNQKRVSLHYHLKLDPGLEEGRTSLAQYRSNLSKLMQYLRGKRQSIIKEIERDMKRAAKNQQFEKAAHLRNQLVALRQLSQQSLFGDHERLDASLDQALVELSSILELSKPPQKIEGFDISHMSGTDTVASMVVFVNGLPDKAAYRKFKMILKGNDDFAHMAEVITRRFSDQNRKKWPLPDLVLIDGGKGQLSAALGVMDGLGINIPCIGLAKRFEQIIVNKLAISDQQLVTSNTKKLGGHMHDSDNFLTIDLPHSSNAVKLLQRIRDESHRFAVSYHSTLKVNRQTASVLDDIPGVGPATRKKMLRKFGSVRGIKTANSKDLEEILGKAKAEIVSDYLKD